MFGIDLRDPRLQAISGHLEKGNYKKALADVNKVLKKHPTFTAAKALKAIVFLKSGKISDATSIAEEVIRDCPTDEPTLSIILSYLRETDQCSREEAYLNEALKKCPNREDLLVSLFLNQVQTGNFSAQQATARKLSSLFSTRTYAYWMIVSTLLQAECDPSLGERMFLPLAEKLLMREATNKRMTKHMEFQLLLDVLLRVGKQKEAMELLNDTTLLGQLDKLDCVCDYSEDRLKLLASLNLWDDAFILAKDCLRKNADNWNIWSPLIELACQGSSNSATQRKQDLLTLTSEFAKEYAHARGPALAQLDFLARLSMSDSLTYSASSILPHLHSYLDHFSSKPICAFDIAYLIPALLPEENVRAKFLSSLMESLGGEEIRSPADGKQTIRFLCVHQILRVNRFLIDLPDLLKTYFSFSPERIPVPSEISTKLGDERFSDGVVDLCLSDGFLQLILSSLVEQPDANSFGLALLAAYWTEYLGVVHASNNHHFRLRLCTLFSPHILACPDLSVTQLQRLEAKQLLLVSLSYLVMFPTPVLSIWSSTTSTSNTQSETPNSLSALYQRLRAMADSTVSEAQEGILAAYRRGAYTRVCEFTQFADRLRHADAYLATRVELAYWHLVADDFDSSLEQMGSMTKELDLLQKRIYQMADCRDFSVSPTFDPIEKSLLTKEDTFQDLVSWVKLRLLGLQTIRYCSELVMACVRMECTQLGMTNQGDKSDIEERSANACKRLDQCVQELNALSDVIPALKVNDPTDVASLCVSVLLPPKRFFTSPPQLPTTRMTSLYYYGFYRTLLGSGVVLIKNMYNSLLSECANESEQTSALNSLLASFTVECQSANSDTSILATLASNWPNPPDLQNSGSAESNQVNPAGILLLFAAVYDAIGLCCMFCSMAASALRPQSHHHHSTKSSRRKTQKPNGPLKTTELDRFGYHLLSAVNQLKTFCSNIHDHIVTWATWVKNHSQQYMVNLAAQTCSSTLPETFCEQYPSVVPKENASLFAELTQSYEESFGRLCSGFQSKLSSLDRICKELRPYDDAVNKLSECSLEENTSP